jgi:predicted histone-like DNA-binding protein
LIAKVLAASILLFIFASNFKNMAIQYRLLQHKIKGSENYGKYYAHTVKQGTITLEQIEEMIESNCTAKASDVRLVLRELFDAVKFYMQHGYTVDLKEMGKLSISVKSVCVDNPKEFCSDKHITGFKCNYTPQGKRYQATGEDNGRHIHRSLLDGCEAVEAKYY